MKTINSKEVNCAEHKYMNATGQTNNNLEFILQKKFVYVFLKLLQIMHDLQYSISILGYRYMLTRKDFESDINNYLTTCKPYMVPDCSRLYKRLWLQVRLSFSNRLVSESEDVSYLSSKCP